MNETVKSMIAEAEAVIVSVGEEFAPVLSPLEEDELFLYRKSDALSKLDSDSRELRAYNKLRELLVNKPYFIVNMNDDGLIYRSELLEQFIVSPCGNLQKMQCGEHIGDAAQIREAVLASGDVSKAICPLCGKKASFHTIQVPGYMEEGYLERWQNYKNMLQGSMNRPICFLELGVGFRFPQVVRLPFERAVLYNHNAKLIRINAAFPQIPDEIKERSVSIKENSVDWILKNTL